MEHWHTPYLGLQVIPPELTEFELTRFFTFSEAERALIDERRKNLYRLAVALHIGFVRMAGRTLDAYKQIPKTLWAHLAGQLGIQAPEIGTLRALYDERPRALIDHQKLAYEALGFSMMSEHQRRYLVRWLKETLRGRPQPSALLGEVKTWLYHSRILIPDERVLRRLIAEAIRAHEERLNVTLARALSESTIDTWSRALPAREGEHGSLQQWLWAVPLRQSTVQMGEIFDKIDRLYELKVAQPWPAELNDATVRHYARRCANRPASVAKRIQGNRRLETACFMRYALCAGTDQLLTMVRQWILELTRQAFNQIDGAQPDAARQLRDFVQRVKTLASDKTLRPAKLSQKLCELADETLKRQLPSRRSLVRLRIVEKTRQSRALLARLMRLPLRTQTQHKVIDAIDVLRKVYAQRGTPELPPSVTGDFGRAWGQLIADKDRRRALAAFEWATLFALRVALRNGSVFVEHSFAFRSQATLLIPEDEWRAHRNSYYARLNLPLDAKAFLKPILEHLDEGLERLAQAGVRGEVRIDNAVHLSPLIAEAEDAHIKAFREALYAQRPVGQLPEIILEIDSEVRFSWILLGREPRTRAELLLVYAAVLAHGTSMSAAEIARMIPELTPAAIRQMMRMVADERKLRQAADAVLEFMNRHPIAAHWGRAELASSDMMSLETARTVWQARADPRRRTASIGVYTHVLDRWGIFYDQPIVLKERQAGAAIEGMVRQTAVDELAQLAVDTHGYTDFAMSQARFLGFDLCPRLSHLRDRALHVPIGHLVPEELFIVVAGDVRVEAIEAHYDGVVRVAASVLDGRCTAVEAFQRFGSAARGQSVYEAGVQLGRLLRTIFLIDYFTNPQFRREIQHALNRGEAVHTVQRAMHAGKIPTELAKRPESMAAVSSSLTLLTNAVMAWNTKYMQRAADAMEALSGEKLRAEDVRRCAPTRIEGINLRGTFDFPLAQYAMRILPTTAHIVAAATRARTG